ncbi:hypothetical protein ACXDTG_002473 [Klebsiella pneumoniae]
MLNGDLLLNGNYIRRCEHEELISIFPFPVLLRSRNGEYIYANECFSSEFLAHSEASVWFSEMSLSEHFMSKVVSKDNCFAFEERAVIGGRLWSVCMVKVLIKNILYGIWFFFDRESKGRLYDTPLLIKERVDSFKKVIEGFNEKQTVTFSLYCLGASHNLIAKILNISPRTSKNRIYEIHERFQKHSKDDFFLLIHAGGLSQYMVNDISKIITNKAVKLINGTVGR